ncbi:MAG TPA: class I SAM-dependent methyltransferase [Solirubrobacterales bacterium]|nr:class I SAM-dependent methyltransferase [Solirubrobacterales bacterium]
MASNLDRADPAYAGQAIYSRAFLGIYDFVAYGINCPYLWRCPKSRFVEHYDAHVSGRHLDIGVGTGLLLDECRFPVADPQITLMDLNPNSLASAAARIRRYSPRTHRANVLGPWGLAPARFDSVALCHLLHCLPGAMAAKAPIVFAEASQVLAPGGVLFGATILGRGVHLSAPARGAAAIANRRGALGNREDDLVGLDRALAQVFPTHEVEVEGAVALFAAATSCELNV